MISLRTHAPALSATYPDSLSACLVGAVMILAGGGRSEVPRSGGLERRSPTDRRRGPGPPNASSRWPRPPTSRHSEPLGPGSKASVTPNGKTYERARAFETPLRRLVASSLVHIQAERGVPDLRAGCRDTRDDDDRQPADRTDVCSRYTRGEDRGLSGARALAVQRGVDPSRTGLAPMVAWRSYDRHSEAWRGTLT